MDIALIGGHGKVALHLIPLLHAAGHQVDAVIRNPQHRDDVVEAGARAVVADVEAMDTDALTDLLRGHDVVVWSAGAGGATLSAHTPSTGMLRSAPWMLRLLRESRGT